MITYDKLWKCMDEKKITQYRLLASGISHSTLMRLKRNQSVSIDTIDKLCSILQCKVEEIMEYFESVEAQSPNH